MTARNHWQHSQNVATAARAGGAAPPIELIDLSLQPKQMDLLKAMKATGAGVPTIWGWGGAKGAAKSGGLRRIALAMRFLFPGTTGWIVRKIWEDLRLNHVEEYFREWPWLEQHYNVNDKEISIPMTKLVNGKRVSCPPSVLGFRHAESLKKVRQKFAGPQCHDLYVDQAEQFDAEALVIMPTACRWPGAAPGECKTAFFFNPGGPGTEYLRRVFWTKHKWEKGEIPGNFGFIQAYGWDNYEWFRTEQIKSILDPRRVMSIKEFYELPEMLKEGEPSRPNRFDMFITQTTYGRQLNSLPTGLRAGYLLGTMDRFAGQYFTAVWDEDKVVQTNDRIGAIVQPWWVRWLATDWGYSHYMPTVWFATGKLSPAEFKRHFGKTTEWPVDVVVIYRELVVKEMAEADVARLVVDGGEYEDSGDKVAFGGTPAEERPEMRHHYFSVEKVNDRRKGTDHNVPDLMNPVLKGGGMPELEPADSERIPGWRLLFSMLRQTCQLLGMPDDQMITKQMVVEGGPMLLISAHCADVIGAFPLAKETEEQDGDVLKVEGVSRADDIMDTVRYGCKSYLRPRGQAPREVRARELAEAVREEHPGDQTELAMTMRKFYSNENRRKRRRRGV
jgi:hypothetical protein